MIFATLTVLMTMGATASAQSTFCTEAEAADPTFFSCMHSVADYTQWMVAPNREAQKGKLNQAIDQLYEDLQNDWTGPLSDQRYVRRLYILIPALLGLYLLALYLIIRYSNPPADFRGPPKWGLEKLFIFGLAIVCIGIVVGERVYTYTRMEREYQLVPSAIERFIHVRPPAQLANATGRECETLFQDNDVLLARCKARWANQSEVRQTRLLTSSFTDPELVRGLINIGTTCRQARVPEWIARPDALQEVRMECPLLSSGDSVVTLGNLRDLYSGLPRWLMPQDGGLLHLENAFHVSDTGGGLVYQQRVEALLGREVYKDYRRRFLETSAFWGAGLFLFLIVGAFGTYTLRRRQLEEGLGNEGRILRLILPVLAGLAFVAAGLGAWFVLKG